MNIIEEVIRHIKSNIVEDVQEYKTCFHGNKVPSISIESYIERLIENINLWTNENDEKNVCNTIGAKCIYIAVIYLNRSGIKITPKSIHRYIMAGTLIADKFISDYPISNKFWSKVGGCALEDLNVMEAEFCRVLNWNFNVN